MNEEAIKTRIRQGVIGKVHSGAARMRSRAYFALRAALIGALAALALGISGFVLSFIAFSIHESGEQFLLGFGMRGIATFFILFPYVLLAADIAAILLLEWLLQGFARGYRVSLLSLFVGVFGASATLAGALYLTPLHNSLLLLADRGQLPLLGEGYERIHDSHISQGIFRGTVQTVEGDRIVIGHEDGDHDADDGTRTVILMAGQAGAYRVGERVYILGTSTGETVMPYGMERFDREPYR